MQKYAAPAAVAVALVLVAVLAFWPAGEGGGGGEGDSHGENQGSRASHSGGSGDGQVEATFHIMSKCPYGVKVVDAITPVARKLGNRFKLHLQYIGRAQGNELTSMHGADEVQGDKLELCVHEHGSYDGWLSFLDCLNENYRRIPSGWEQCAEHAHLDVNEIRSCAEGDEGTRLLRASFEASDRAGARGSPTIFVAGERYSGGRSEQAFARSICAQYEGGRPAYCDEIPPPPQVPVTVLADRRCKRSECDTDRQVAALKARIPGAKITNVDYSSDRGRSLFEKAGVKMLPAILIGREIQQDRDAFKTIARSAKRSGDMFVQSVGRFDPVKGSWVERPEVPIQFLVDGRCKTRECQGASRFEAFIKRQVPRAKVSTIDWGDDGAQALWKRISTAMEDMPAAKRRPLGLPLAMFGQSIELEADAFSRLERRFVKVGDQYMFQLGRWDPTAEICDNETDDDGNGQVDCDDEHCAEQMVCRPEKARQLSAFVMAQCPYGIKVLNAMQEVLENFGRDRSKINFRVEYIGQVRGDELSTMHGEGELAEDLREICAQQHYPDNYAFMDYIWCRNKNIRSPEWRSCVQEGMDADVIQHCAEGDEGRGLLTKSFNLGASLGFTGSPSWLLNNRLTIRGRDPESIKTEYCEHNELPECSNTLSKSAPRSKRGRGAGGGGGGSCG